MLRENASPVVIEDELGLDPVAMVFEQPVHTIRLTTFFVRGERENDVAVGDVVFLLEPNQGGGHDGVAVFHILGAAAVEVAIFFDELEGISGPILAAGFDYVKMSDQEHWFVLA